MEDGRSMVMDEDDAEMKEVDAVERRSHRQEQLDARENQGEGNGETAGRSATWSFVQMNMSLLPIARPLPVNVCHRECDGVISRKLRTPSNKLHLYHRAVRNAAHISPRRDDWEQFRRGTDLHIDTGVGADNTANAVYSSSARVITAAPATAKPIAIPYKAMNTSSIYSQLSASWQARATTPTPNEDDTSRTRSYSEDLTLQDAGSDDAPYRFSMSSLESTASSSVGYGCYASPSPSPCPSPSPILGSHPPTKGTSCKGKRVLELQDEERRLYPDEHASLLSPSKRLRRV